MDASVLESTSCDPLGDFAIEHFCTEGLASCKNLEHNTNGHHVHGQKYIVRVNMLFYASNIVSQIDRT